MADMKGKALTRIRNMKNSILILVVSPLAKWTVKESSSGQMANDISVLFSKGGDGAKARWSTGRGQFWWREHGQTANIRVDLIDD